MSGTNVFAVPNNGGKYVIHSKFEIFPHLQNTLYYILTRWGNIVPVIQ